MAITLLRVTDKLYQCLDNKTMSIVKAKGYRYKPAVNGNIFKLGSETFTLTKRSSTFYKYFDLNRKIDDHFELIASFKDFRSPSSFSNNMKTVYMRFIDNVFLGNLKGYYSIALSTEEYKGGSSFTGDYIILVFDSNFNLVGITKNLNNAKDLDPNSKICWEWCNDSKLMILGKFNRSLNIRPKLIRIHDCVEF